MFLTRKLTSVFKPGFCYTEGITTDFHMQLFAAQDDLDLELVLEHVPRKVTADMNEQLTRPFAASEVERALFLMGAHKAPGPDGLTTGFFQLHWDLMGPDIIEAVLNFLNGALCRMG